MNKLFLLLIPLLLSGFIHLWNPVGYPDVFFDEGIYMRRAVNLLETGNPQEGNVYDHPYFGQIAIASVLAITNYSDIKPDTNPESLQSLYWIPRIFMGVLAVLDTFLIYKIVQIRYGGIASFLSASLFAVLPFTWIFKRILLDSIVVPLVLGAILLAIYSTKTKQKRVLIIFSGCLLGLAVFTKIPAFTMIFVVAWIIYTDRKKISDILLLLIPFALIPLIWPVNAIILDQFDLWQKGVLWQAHRTNSVLDIFGFLAVIDPMMFVLGLSGIIIAALRKDKFLLLWFIPFIVFLSVVGYKQYFHWMIVVPAMCIAAGILLESIRKWNIIKKTTYAWIISAVLIFGFVSTTLLIINDVSINQFQALSYVLENYDDRVTILTSPVYSWILYEVFERENTPKDYSFILFYPPDTEKTVIMVDEHYRIDLARGPQLQNAIDRSTIVKTFDGIITKFNSKIYPYTNMQANGEATQIQIREGMRVR
ncbi:MAG TPA: glycosyltransferase family 39 protein [Nitrosarchaeum sp.]|nr:glycosyltransferase family 39 protein [Nitrosarchaeum sp.]